jgi:hypothetical protein
MRISVALVCTLVLVAWSVSLTIAENEKLFEDPAQKNNMVFIQGSATANEADPHLTLKPVVESPNKNKSDFYIEVENLIGPQVSIVQYVVRTEQFSDGVIFREDERPIVPEATRIAIPGKMSIGLTQPSAFVDILLIYKTPLRTFGSAYKFLIDHTGKLREYFFPVSARAERSAFDIEKELQKEAIAALTKPAGTIFFMLSETRSDGSPNIFRIRTPDRSISFNSTTKTAQFGSQSNILQSTFDKKSGGLHRLTASWDDSKQTISLAIDGREIVI